MRSEVSAFLENLIQTDALRIAIVGIGNDLNGDDAAGVLLARALLAAQQPGRYEMPAGFTAPAGLLPGADRLLIIDAGPSPESFTGPLRRFAPGQVILVDAAQMGEAPGALRIFGADEAHGMSASTHTMPPSMLGEFLTAELGCRVALIGIQAKRLEMDDPLSDEVGAGVVELYREMCAALSR